jgi:KDO2-lipid IV(A) lauroyltransferase
MVQIYDLRCRQPADIIFKSVFSHAMQSIVSAILYYLVLKPISLLPFPILYAFSDFFFFIIYYLTPYRKKVVTENLKRSFPDKSDKEIAGIQKKFYRHFCDLIFETLKLFSASQQSISKRIKLLNPEFLDKYYAKGKSIVLASGHYANWEWPAITLSLHSKFKGSGVYSRLSNKFFDRKLRQTRAAFGTELFTNKEVSDFMEARLDKMYLFGFINDQSPSNPARGHWATFLNQPTCMLLGAEKNAVKYDLPVVYAAVRKVKRGFFSLEYITVSDNPRAEKEFYITEECQRINEGLIMTEPEWWLWTHRRWKHKHIGD